MKFNVNQQDLQQALSYCQGVIEKRSTLPILSNILLDLKDKDLTITATDLDLIFVHKIDNVEVLEPGKTTTTSLVRRGAENENQVGTSNIQGISFNNDGTKMFACDIANKRIIQYTLTSAFDTTTLLYARELSVSARGDCQSVTFNNDGSKMYVICW